MELYRKIHIKSEADLPEKYGTYDTSIGRIRFGGVKSYNRFIRVGHLKIDWYLQPIEITDKDIEAWADDELGYFSEQEKRYILTEGRIEGAKAVINGEIKHIENGTRTKNIL